MSEVTEARSGLLARKATARTVGPLSALQLVSIAFAAIASVLILAALNIAGIPLLLSVWVLGAVGAIRISERSGPRMVSELVRAATHTGPRARHTLTADHLATPKATRKRKAPGTNRVFLAAPGLLARATGVPVPGFGVAFAIPENPGAKRKVKVTTAWTISGPAIDTAPVAEANAAIGAWAEALDALSRIEGLRTLALHCDTASTGTLTGHSAASESVSAREYQRILAELGAQPASRITLAATWTSQDAATAGVPELRNITTTAGMRLHKAVEAEHVTARLMVSDQLGIAEPDITGQMPAYPAYEEGVRGCVWASGAHTVVLVAQASDPVPVDYTILAPLLTKAEAGVRVRTMLQLRPVSKSAAQGAARYRRAKLQRTVNAANESFFSSLLIDTHAAAAELEALDELGERGARGQGEIETVLVVTLTSASREDVERAARKLTSDCRPLLLAPVAFPAPLIAAANAPTGVIS